MPRFITFFSYTGEAAKAMIEHPSDRSAASKALVESVGGTQEAFYWMQGKHDGFIITTEILSRVVDGPRSGGGGLLADGGLLLGRWHAPFL